MLPTRFLSLQIIKFALHSSYREFVGFLDDDPTVTLLHLDSELIFKDSEDVHEYKGELSEDIEDPEAVEEVIVEETNARKLPALPSLKKEEPSGAAKPEEKKTDPADDEEKGVPKREFPFISQIWMD